MKRCVQIQSIYRSVPITMRRLSHKVRRVVSSLKSLEVQHKHSLYVEREKEGIDCYSKRVGFVEKQMPGKLLRNESKRENNPGEEQSKANSIHNKNVHFVFFMRKELKS